MQIEMQAHSFPLTDALRSHAEWQLRFTLTFFDKHIQRVIMRLSDTYGPRGGVDKRCHLQVVLAGLSDVVIEDTDADLYVAIGRATDRAVRTIERRLARRALGFVHPVYSTHYRLPKPVTTLPHR
jgi:ribosome-associated translation inhibitor RaiA